MFCVTAETAPLPEIKEDDLQDTHSDDAASNIGTNVSTVVPSYVANAVVSLPAVDLCGSVTEGAKHQLDGISSPAVVFTCLAACTISSL